MENHFKNESQYQLENENHQDYEHLISEGQENSRHNEAQTDADINNQSEFHVKDSNSTPQIAVSLNNQSNHEKKKKNLVFDSNESGNLIQKQKPMPSIPFYTSSTNWYRQSPLSKKLSTSKEFMIKARPQPSTSQDKYIKYDKEKLFEEIMNLRNKNNMLEQENKRKTGHINQLNIALINAGKNGDNLGFFSTLKMELKNSKETIQSLEQEILNFKRSTKYAKQNELEIENYMLTTEMRNYLTLLNDKTSIENSLQSSNQSLKRTNNILSKEVELFKGENERLNIEIDRKNSVIQELKKEAVEQERKIKGLFEIIDKFKQQVSSRENDVKRLNKELSRIRNQINIGIMDNQKNSPIEENKMKADGSQKANQRHQDPPKIQGDTMKKMESVEKNNLEEKILKNPDLKKNSKSEFKYPEKKTEIKKTDKKYEAYASEKKQEFGVYSKKMDQKYGEKKPDPKFFEKKGSEKRLEKNTSDIKASPFIGFNKKDGGEIKNPPKFDVKQQQQKLPEKNK